MPNPTPQPNDLVYWNETIDHSKWTITKTQTGNKWVCLGDINRQFSQYKRGGGQLCIPRSDVWGQFFPIVTAFEKCPTDP